MKHFLITRFNIKSQNWQHTKSGALTNSDTWLKQRFSLFETYCLPSVKNQSNQSFKWVIIFDIDTPETYLNRIKKLTTSNANIKILLTKSFETLKVDLINFIKNELTQNNQFIITTRIDNDDMIHLDFVNHIQNSFIKKHKTLIDLTTGYQLTISKNKFDARLYTLNYNPFLSLIENSNQFETIMSKNHEHWKTIPNRIIFNKSPLWIQLIHSENLVNAKISSLKKTKELNLNKFGITSNIINSSLIKIKLFNIVTSPIRLLTNIKIALRDLLNQQL